MPTLPVSLFTRAHETDPIAEELDLDALVDPSQWPKTHSKSENVLFSPALYPPGASRGNEAVRELTALVLDYDDGTTPDTAFAAWDGIERYLHSTFSSSPQRPKFRLVIPLHEPVPAHAWLKFWQLATEVAEGTPDPNCKDPSRMFFAPAIPGKGPYEPIAMRADGERLSYDLLVGEPVPAKPSKPARPALRVVRPATADRSPGTAGGLFEGMGDDRRQIRAELPVEVVEGECGFMAHAREHADELSEPAWRAQLSIAIRCDGGRELCHELSRPYPDYDPDETDALLDRLSQVGPFTRSAVEGTPEAQQHDFCGACKHRDSCGESGPLNAAKSAQPVVGNDAVDRLRADLARVEKTIEETRLRKNFAANVEAKSEAAAEIAELQARRRAIKARISKLAAQAEKERLRREVDVPTDVDEATWRELDLDRDDQPRNTERNLLTIFETDPVYAGLGYNELSRMPEDTEGRLDLSDFGDPGTGAVVMRDVADRYGIRSIKFSQVVAPLVAASRDKPFHPVRDWLDALTPWDGEDRVVDLMRALGAEIDDTGLHEAYLRCTLVAAVARVFEPGCKVDTMLVLQGAQGVGKSSGLQALFEGETPLGWYSSTTIDMTQRDARLAIHRAWVTEFAELAAMGKRDSETIKAFITEVVDYYREPYGRAIIPRKRACLFVGSTNEEHFLRDPTGSRRFWILPVVERVDVDAVLELREQVFAQAVHAWAHGARHWLPHDLEAEQVRVNSARWETPDPVFESLLPWFESLKPGSDVKLRDAAQRAGFVGASLTQAVSKQVASCLRRLGMVRTHSAKGKVWRKPLAPADD